MVFSYLHILQLLKEETEMVKIRIRRSKLNKNRGVKPQIHSFLPVIEILHHIKNYPYNTDHSVHLNSSQKKSNQMAAEETRFLCNRK